MDDSTSLEELAIAETSADQHNIKWQAKIVAKLSIKKGEGDTWDVIFWWQFEQFEKTNKKSEYDKISERLRKCVLVFEFDEGKATDHPLSGESKK